MYCLVDLHQDVFIEALFISVQREYSKTSFVQLKSVKTMEIPEIETEQLETFGSIFIWIIWENSYKEDL